MAAKNAGLHLYDPTGKKNWMNELLNRIKDIDIQQGSNPLITKWQSKMNGSNVFLYLVIVFLDTYEDDFR